MHVDYHEMARIAADPTAVRAMAKFITTALGDRLSSSERTFLTKLSEFEGPDPISMRQREWLHSLRSHATRRSKVCGYRASKLIRMLWELRFDLSESSEEFVVTLYELQKGVGDDLALSEAQWRHVFALCREVGEIEHYVAYK
jgi:hypothetical protein